MSKTNKNGNNEVINSHSDSFPKPSEPISPPVSPKPSPTHSSSDDDTDSEPEPEPISPPVSPKPSSTHSSLDDDTDDETDDGVPTPEDYYHDSRIVLTELTSIFNERTTCSEDILFRLQELRDLLN